MEGRSMMVFPALGRSQFGLELVTEAVGHFLDHPGSSNLHDLRLRSPDTQVKLIGPQTSEGREARDSFIQLVPMDLLTECPPFCQLDYESQCYFVCTRRSRQKIQAAA